MRFKIHKIEMTESTNDDVKAAAERGTDEGLVVWALAQTAGRGRQGRAWQSPKGNLYFSFLLRPPTEKRTWGNYSFVAALAAGEAVRGFLPAAKVELKWPNDVLVDGKKICGILLEAGEGRPATRSLGEGWLVAGVGVNIARKPAAPLYPATCLAAEMLNPPSLDGVLDKFLDSFGVWYERMNEEGFAPVRAAWLEYAKKGAMRVHLPSGDEIVGEFADLDEEGNLVLRLEDGEVRKISAGDVG